jgi:isoleucyl-tRNA synthetase
MALVDEAFAREVIRRLQSLRKERDLDVDARIDVTPAGADRARAFEAVIAEQACASSLAFGEVDQATAFWEVEGHPVEAEVAVIGAVEAA